jgi:stage II sporulation protein D
MKNRLYLTYFMAGWLCVVPHGLSESADHSPWFGSGPKAQVVGLQLPARIKVAILHSRSVVIGSSGSFSYVLSKNGKPVVVKKRGTLRIHGGKHGMSLGQKTLTSAVQIEATEEDAHLTVNGRAYRGSLLIRPRNGLVDVINLIGLEDYLNGVLPREVGVDWPVESLKAQAVISRTYVLANFGKSNSKGYDVSSDVFSQVYGGLQDEHPASNAAVKATEGEVLIDDKGLPVLTFFHSSCGGETESPQYVWSEIKDPPSYLASVSDPFCKDDPFYNWVYEISASTLQKRLRKAHLKLGTIKSVSVGKTSPSGRASTFLIESSKEKSKSRTQTTISGNAFRIAVGPDELRSTLLTEIKKRGTMFRFEGRGWGHGVGLCQWGARGRALAGHSYGKIIEGYYPHVRLIKAASIEQQAKK